MKTIKQLACCFRKMREDLDRVEDANASERFGNMTLLGGSGTGVADTKIKSTSIVYLTRKSIIGPVGNLTYLLTPDTNFVVVSSNASDLGEISYHVKY